MSEVIDIDSLTSITVEPGSKVILELSANRSAHFNWFLDSITNPNLQLIGPAEGVYVPPSNARYGEEGKQQFTIEASNTCQEGTLVDCVFQLRDSSSDVADMHYLSVELEDSKAVPIKLNDS